VSITDTKAMPWSMRVDCQLDPQMVSLQAW